MREPRRGAPRSRAARRTRRSRSRRQTRSPDPRRTRTRAQLVCEDRVGGNGEEACVRKERTSRRGEDVETFGRSGEISETSDNTHEAHDGDRRACAFREPRLRRRTFGSRRPLPSSLKSLSVFARAHLRRKRRRAIRARVPSPPPLQTNAHLSRARAEAKPPRRGRKARAWRPRAHATGGTLDPFDDAVERAPRDVTARLRVTGSRRYAPHTSRREETKPAARGLHRLGKCRFFSYVFLVWKKSYY